MKCRRLLAGAMAALSLVLCFGMKSYAGIQEGWQNRADTPLRLAYAQDIDQQLCMSSYPALLSMTAVTASDAPSKPIARTVVGPLLLACGLTPTVIGIIVIAGGAAASSGGGDAGGIVGGAAYALGGILCAVGVGFIIPGTIITVKAVKGWKAYNAAQKSAGNPSIDGMEVQLSFQF